jgi:ATP-dependent DNA ligase
MDLLGDVDIRNTLDVELTRAVGGYVDELPSECWVERGAWVQEMKEDGYRESFQLGKTVNFIMGRNRHGKTKGVEASEKNPFVGYSVPWMDAIRLPEFDGTLLDGELIWPGHGSAEVSSAIAASPDELHYVVFDCLFFGGEDIRGFALSQRQELAQETVAAIRKKYSSQWDTQELRFVDQAPNDKNFFDSWIARGIEGTILKRRDSKYHEAGRWRKAKAKVTVDAIIINYVKQKAGGSPTKGIKPKPTGNASGFMVGLKKGRKIVPVGWMRGLPAKDKQDGMRLFKDNYKGRVVEMIVSGWDGKRFRWCKFERWRDDKTPDDCTFKTQIEEIFKGAA